MVSLVEKTVALPLRAVSNKQGAGQLRITNKAEDLVEYHGHLVSQNRTEVPNGHLWDRGGCREQGQWPYAVIIKNLIQSRSRHQTD